MKNSNRHASALACFSLLLAVCAQASPVGSKTDQLFAAWNRPDSPGAAVVVIQDGAVVVRRT